MEVHFSAPSLPLSHFVEVMWLVKGKLPYSKDKILPDGSMELILNFGSPYRVFPSAEPPSGTLCKRAWVTGNRDQALVIEPMAETNLMDFRLKPGAAHAFFKLPIHEMTGRVVELDALFGNRLELLKEKIFETPKPGIKFAILERFLINELGHNLSPDPILAYALDYLEAGRRESSIHTLAKELGYSQKQTARIFAKQVGMRPKVLQRIFRFQRLVHTLHSTKNVDWPRIALDMGYFDQAHMAKEMKYFTGLSPNAYLREKSPTLNFIHIE